MPITLGTNVSSLRAQRQLFQTEQQLGTVFERLASGQRINRASDDAAGLAIAESLNADARVFNQGVRNGNDGLSLLSIAEGALTELSGILIRIQELAEQSANGVYTREQRLSLDDEANKLHLEYNRIIESTEFNGVRIIDQSTDGVSIQVGYSSIESSLGEDIRRYVGTGGFTESENIDATGVFYRPGDENIGDINNDGNLDIVVGSSSGAQQYFGNGDGTFSSGGGIGSTTSSSSLYDLDGDGNLDFIATRDFNDDLRVFLGNGTGAGYDLTTYSLGDNPQAFDIGDVNNDGVADIVVHIRGDQELNILLGNGDGTFQSALTIQSYGNTSYSEDLELVDVNDDGNLDVIHTAHPRMYVFLGDGAGSFSESFSIDTDFNASQGLEVGDFNHDGIKDVLASTDLFYGQADGTFSEVLSFVNSSQGQVVDLDGDGDDDFYRNNGDIYYNNGDGTFELSSGASGYFQFGDFNGNGVSDRVSFSGNVALQVYLQDSVASSTIARPDLTTQASSLETLEIMQTKLSNIAQELGNIGAYQQRLVTATSNLMSARENYIAAESRIRDADIAIESASLVRTNILQQAAASVLAQANQQPALALQLLG